MAAATTREELVREAIFAVLLSSSREAEEEGGREDEGSYSLVREQLAENLKASISTEERTISTGATHCSYLVSGKKWDWSILPVLVANLMFKKKKKKTKQNIYNPHGTNLARKKHQSNKDHVKKMTEPN